MSGHYFGTIVHFCKNIFYKNPSVRHALLSLKLYNPLKFESGTSAGSASIADVGRTP